MLSLEDIKTQYSLENPYLGTKKDKNNLLDNISNLTM
jgi:hypothetical protein